MILALHWNLSACTYWTLITVVVSSREILLYYVVSNRKVTRWLLQVLLFAEKSFSWQRIRNKKPLIERVVQAFLQGIDIYPVDREVAEIYGQFKAEIISRFGPREKSRRKTTRIEELGGK